RRRPEFRQLLIGISTSRYLPPSGTAGLARSLVSGKSLVPAPPPMTIARVFCWRRAISINSPVFGAGIISRHSIVRARDIFVTILLDYVWSHWLYRASRSDTDPSRRTPQAGVPRLRFSRRGTDREWLVGGPEVRRPYRQPGPVDPGSAGPRH